MPALFYQVGQFPQVAATVLELENQRIEDLWLSIIGVITGVEVCHAANTSFMRFSEGDFIGWPFGITTLWKVSGKRLNCVP